MRLIRIYIIIIIIIIIKKIEGKKQSLNGHWHRELNYVFSEITKFNFVKTIMFWAKTMSAKEG